MGGARHIEGKYCIAEYLDAISDDDWVITFDDPEMLSQVLDDDNGNAGKATMLSDETNLQLICFHLYREEQ